MMITGENFKMFKKAIEMFISTNDDPTLQFRDKELVLKSMISSVSMAQIIFKEEFFKNYENLNITLSIKSDALKPIFKQLKEQVEITLEDNLLNFCEGNIKFKVKYFINGCCEHEIHGVECECVWSLDINEFMSFLKNQASTNPNIQFISSELLDTLIIKIVSDLVDVEIEAISRPIKHNNGISRIRLEFLKEMASISKLFNDLRIEFSTDKNVYFMGDGDNMDIKWVVAPVTDRA